MMGVPMILLPQTGEEYAVARRTSETGAGLFLKNTSADEIRAAVSEVLTNRTYTEAAQKMCRDFRSCPGAPGAADFIEGIIQKRSI